MMKFIAPVLVLFALLASTAARETKPVCGPRGEIKVVAGYGPLCFHKSISDMSDRFYE